MPEYLSITVGMVGQIGAIIPIVGVQVRLFPLLVCLSTSERSIYDIFFRDFSFEMFFVFTSEYL